MEKIVFKDDWKAVFAKNGLTNIDDFFNFTGGEVINRNSKRNVTVFELEDDGKKTRFFMKRFHDPHFKDMLAVLKNFGKMWSQGHGEWANAEKLFASGIPTYQPVCYGDQMIGPFEKRSVFITKELDGQCLTDYVAGKWDGLSPDQKKTLLTTMAQLAADAHAKKMSFPDLYVWHYWVLKADQEYQLGKIDLHMTKHNAKISDQIRDLGAIHYSMIDDYFTEADKEFLFDEYFRISGRDKGKIYKKVLARSKKVSSRRRKPNY